MQRTLIIVAVLILGYILGRKFPGVWTSIGLPG